MRNHNKTIMLLATPKELLNKISYEGGTPHPNCNLTESEQIIYEKFLTEFDQALRERFEDIEDE